MTALEKVVPYDYPVVQGFGIGDEFREKSKKFSPAVRNRLQKTQDAGKLQSDLVAFYLIMNRLLHEWIEGDGVMIIEGAPRSVKQTNELYDFVVNHLGKRIILVHLLIDDDLAAERIKQRNLEEENLGKEPRKETRDPKAMRTKLRFYHKEVVPAIVSMMSKKGATVIPVEVTREKDPDMVLEEVVGGILEIL